jgi:hypothetical protein
MPPKKKVKKSLRKPPANPFVVALTKAERDLASAELDLLNAEAEVGRCKMVIPALKKTIAAIRQQLNPVEVSHVDYHTPFKIDSFNPPLGITPEIDPHEVDYATMGVNLDRGSITGNGNDPVNIEDAMEGLFK